MIKINYIYLYSRNLIADLLRNNIEKLGNCLFRKLKYYLKIYFLDK